MRTAWTRLAPLLGAARVVLHLFAQHTCAATSVSSHSHSFGHTLLSVRLQAHPADVVVDRCTLCGRGEEGGATDWIACDSCNSWVHFSCDKRPGLGTFDDYANAEQPRSYTCPNCARGAARLAQKAAGGGAVAGQQAVAAEAAAAAAAPPGQEPQPMET